MSKDIWMYLIIQLLEMFHVHSAVISDMKNIKASMVLGLLDQLQIF